MLGATHREELQGLTVFAGKVLTAILGQSLHPQLRGDEMERRTYCVYNQTRECFLSLGVSLADTTFTRMKGLIGRMKLRFDEGIWLVPSSGIHTMGVMFPLDLIYLDENHEVVHAIEYFPTFSISPLRIRSASVLELPTHTIYSSQTQVGDQLLICLVEEMEERLNMGMLEHLKSGAK